MINEMPEGEDKRKEEPEKKRDEKPPKRNGFGDGPLVRRNPSAWAMSRRGGMFG
jgi:hypothetical protein